MLACAAAAGFAASVGFAAAAGASVGFAAAAGAVVAAGAAAGAAGGGVGCAICWATVGFGAAGASVGLAGAAGACCPQAASSPVPAAARPHFSNPRRVMIGVEPNMLAPPLCKPTVSSPAAASRQPEMLSDETMGSPATDGQFTIGDDNDCAGGCQYTEPRVRTFS